MKERNRRLLAKERERLSQRKVNASKQKSKYEGNAKISKAIEEKNVFAAENLDSERILDRSEGISRQRVISRVDRRWEFDIVFRMREKLWTKAERNRKNKYNEESGGVGH